jgi:two-component system, cell cycle response regulator
MRPKILIVDDSRTTRLAWAGAFQPFACDIVEAADGIQGLALARREHPNLVLLDLAMPNMDGAETLSRLRAVQDTRTIPVIIVTGKNHRDAVMSVLKLGVSDYLVKPFTNAELVERVGRVLKLTPASDPAARTRRLEDPLKILLVDDKPAIGEQLKQTLATGNWQLETFVDADAALAYCAQNIPDVILVGLSLPLQAAFSLHARLRQDSRLSSVPVFGLCPKLALDLQTRATREGFSSTITKPIQMEEVRRCIAAALDLDMSGNLFEQNQGVLIAHWPPSLGSDLTTEIVRQIPGRISQAIDSGIDKVVIDLHAVQKAHPGLVRLLVSIVKMCTDLGLRYRMAAPDGLAKECRTFDEARQWDFSSSVDEAVLVLNTNPAAVA